VHKVSPLQIVCVAKAIRTFGFGCISVVLALFLLKQGFSAAAVGAIFSATLIEDAIVTTLVSTLAVRIGLRRILLAASILIIICGASLAFCAVPWVIVCAAVFGIVSPAGYEGGPFSPIEQTLISESEPPSNLTRAFSWYNLTGFGGAALGALFAGWAMNAHNQHLALFGLGMYQSVFLLYALGGAVLCLLYSTIKIPTPLLLEKEFAQAVSARKTKEPLLQRINLHKSRGNVFKLASLQGLDAFGGGFVAQSLIAYWFFLRYQAGPEFMGPVFFWANVFAAISFTVAPLVVQRIGLLKTMVFTHLPCSLALCLIPFMPDASAAAIVLLCRSLFSSMDIPVRQAYSMLLVCPDERPAAAGIISAARAVCQGAGPLASGIVLNGAGAVFGLPFICAGLTKSVYDIGLYVCFRKVPLETSETVAVLEGETADVSITTDTATPDTVTNDFAAEPGKVAVL